MVRIDVAAFDSIADVIEAEVAQVAECRPIHNKLLRGGEPQPNRSGWAAWEARHPDKVAAKERARTRPSGSVRAKMYARRATADQSALW
jgi:hypothetical protein